jgi:hypothetical protein
MYQNRVLDFLITAAMNLYTRIDTGGGFGANFKYPPPLRSRIRVQWWQGSAARRRRRRQTVISGDALFEKENSVLPTSRLPLETRAEVFSSVFL